jgi:anti-sigma B factor antagonist
VSGLILYLCPGWSRPAQKEAAMTGSGRSPHPEPGRPVPQSGVPALLALPSQEDGQAVLTLVGEIDVTTVDVVREAVRNCLRECPARLSLDLRSVTFCDAAGVRALRQAEREAATARAEFRIIAPGPMVVRVLTLADAADLLSTAQRASAPAAGSQPSA